MIICVSIVDKHKPKGQQHIGTYTFEIPYPAAEHEGQMDFFVKDCPKEREAKARYLIGQFLTLENMPNPVRVDIKNGQQVDVQPVDNKGNPR